MSAHPADIYAIFGAPDAGKSSRIRMVLGEGARRAMIFDPMRELGGFGDRVSTLDELRRRLIAAAPRKPVSLVYSPPDDPAHLKQRYSAFCDLAFVAGDLLVVADELADVTGPGPHGIPPGWDRVMRKGRHQHLRILIGSQRPAGVDKNLWSFATRLRSGRLNFAADVATVANVLNVKHQEFAALVGCQWIERNMRTGEVTRGAVDWRRGKPVDVPRAAPRP